MATMYDVNKLYSVLSDRYQGLLSRGAERGNPTEMAVIGAKLNDVARAHVAYSGEANRLWDITANLGKQVKPMLDKLESKYPEGTRVVPGSTGGAGYVGSQLTEGKSPEQLVNEAPPDVSLEDVRDIMEGESAWYYWQGVDLRWVGGALFLGLAATVWLRRKR